MHKTLNMKSVNLNDIIDNFSKYNILVIGDIMLDEFLWGEVSRLSQEAPVPVVNVKKISTMLGGAANVVNNIISLGGKPVLCGVINSDYAGKKILSKLQNIDRKITEGMIIDSDRPTTVKTRIIARNQQVVRYDIEDRSVIPIRIAYGLINFIEKQIESTNLVIVSDYGKGVISPLTIDCIQTICSTADVPLIIDPNINNSSLYSGALVVTPNHYEAKQMMDNNDEIGENLRKKLDCVNLLITEGKNGISIIRKGQETLHIDSEAKKVYDVTGAGDTFVSVLSLCLASFLDIESSAYLANIAAGIVVGEVGTSVIDIDIFKKEVLGK